VCACLLTPICWIFNDRIAIGLGNPSVAQWLAYAPWTGLLISVSLAAQQRVQRTGEYRRSGLSELAGKCGYVLSGTVGAALGLQVFGLVFATSASALAKLGIVGKRRPHNREMEEPPRLYSMLRLARQYGRLSASLVASHLLLTCTIAIPVITIGRLYSADLVGQYGLVTSTIYLPSGLIGAAIGQVYYQRAASNWAINMEIQSLWANTAKRLIIFGAPVFLAIALVAPTVYPLLFGQEWREAGHIAAYMACSAFFAFISTPMDRTSMVVGAWWYPVSWHAFRTITTGLVAAAAWKDAWPINTFLYTLVAQISLVYMTDFAMQYRFARRSVNG
jgi:teichuronic acid exporter